MTDHREFVENRFKIHEKDVVDSTNDELKRLISRLPETPEYTVIHAKRQEKGRGRRGKLWVSEEGNLYLSMLLRPNCLLSKASQINFVTSLALVDLCKDYGLSPKLKWPNDVLLDGQKVSGVLLESDADLKAHVNWLVVGVGLNVFDAPENMPYPTTSLSKMSGKTHDMNLLISNFLGYFDKRYLNWKEHGFNELREDWLKNSAHEKGKKVIVNADKRITGTFETLTENGALQIRSLTPGKELMTIHSGDTL